MFPIPAAAEPLVQAIRGVFTKPTYDRFVLLMGGMIVTMGRRTVSHVLAAVEPRIKGHWSNYHRLFCHAHFSMWKLAAALVRQVVALLPAGMTIVLVCDDTVDEKDGDRVWAKGPHRDSCRSSRSHTQISFGHQWLVMCILVQLPGVDRPWALPVLCGLCRSPKVAEAIGQRPKPASVVARQLLCVLMRWLPDRKFILLGDSKAVSHLTAVFARRHADRVTVISRLRADANLYGPPKHQTCKCRGPRRRAKKGQKLPSPAQAVARLPRQQTTVNWYGSCTRQVSYVTQDTLWYGKHNNQVVPIRWVGVPGTQESDTPDAYFYCTDQAMPAQRIIELYARRWSIEVTFEEARSLLGLETTRHWCKQSVLRVTPILFGLFTAVSLIWNNLSASKRRCLSRTPCYAKQKLTFADALFAIRREWWSLALLRRCDTGRCLSLIGSSQRRTILQQLSAAA